MKNYETLPPIILDLFEKVRDDKSPSHVRDVYVSRLENIVACCTSEIEAYNRNRFHHKRKL